MEINEIIFRIKKNKLSRTKGITLIADFLGTTKEDAEEIYNEYIEKGVALDNDVERWYN